MNRSKKNLRPILWLTAIAFVMLMGGMAYAADQTVLLNPSTATLSQSDNLDITVNYNCPEKVDTFAVVICYDSTKITLLDPPVTNIFGDAGLIEAYDDTVDNNDGDTATDKYISLYYAGTFDVVNFEFTKDWPQAAVPLDVITVHFQVNATVADGTVTKVNVVDKGEIGTFTGTGSEITVGAVTPTATALDIAGTNALIGTANLVIIDVNAAAYETEKIAGAVLMADVDLENLDEATPILVYCRDAEIAKTEADALAAQGFTAVSYLYDAFANFAADAGTSDTSVQYKLTVNIMGAGTVTGNSADGYQYKNATVTLVADPAADVTWSANAPGGVVTMTGIQTVTATFAGGVNTPPVANAASFTVAVGGQVSGTLTGTDNEGDALTFIKVTDPAQGTLVLNPDGTFTYDNPTTDGTVTFTFKVNDGTEDSLAATVTITVNPAGNTAPVANAANFTVAVGGQVSGTLTGTDNEGDALTFIKVTDPAQGMLSFDANGTFTYDNPTTAGNVTFTFKVNDGTVDSAAATVTITVNPAGNTPPVADTGITVVTTEDIAVQGLLGGTDFDNDTLTFAIVTNPTNGTISNLNANTGTFTYTPNTGFSGTDSLTFKVNDGKVDSATATVNITVNPAGLTPDGDGNGDGYVDIYDALAAAMYDVTLLTEAEIARFAHLDVDQNGVVDINDALAIARYDVGLTCTCTLDQ